MDSFENDVLGNIVQNFNLNHLILGASDGAFNDEDQIIADIQNPASVADKGLIFNLIDNLDGQEDDDRLVKQHCALPDLGQGKAGMTNLRDMGPASATSKLCDIKQEYPVQCDYKKAHVRILEQPASHKLRFRYKCEGRSAGALQGANSHADNKTFPSIKVEGYVGPAVVVVSCVEDKPPYRAHPHSLVGKGSDFKKGICSTHILEPDMICQFQNLGIQCVRKKDAPAALAERESIRVDPFKKGFAHKDGPINLNAIRLCFQVFLKLKQGLYPLDPVVSDVIYDKKSHSDLQIIDYSDDSSPVEGGKKILIFCEKVSKEDIEVHFSLYTKSGEKVTRRGELTAVGVYKQYGISIKTPAYPNQDISEAVEVSMYLYKPSDRSFSEPVDFWYLPNSNRSREAAAEYRQPQIHKATVNAVNKRPRPKKAPEEVSSGPIPKVSPAQLRTAGGVVIETEATDKFRLAELAMPWDYFHQKVSNSPLPGAACANDNDDGGRRVEADLPDEMAGAVSLADVNTGDLINELVSTNFSGLNIGDSDMAGKPFKGDFMQRQSSQLDTPEVSQMSVDSSRKEVASLLSKLS